MVRKRRTKRDPDAFVNVGLHPELHKALARECIDSGQTLRERANEIIAVALKRPDVLRADPAAT